jgi:hypothetical protein
VAVVKSTAIISGSSRVDVAPRVAYVVAGSLIRGKTRVQALPSGVLVKVVDSRVGTRPLSSAYAVWEEGHTPLLALYDDATTTVASAGVREINGYVYIIDNIIRLLNGVYLGNDRVVLTPVEDLSSLLIATDDVNFSHYQRAKISLNGTHPIQDASRNHVVPCALAGQKRAWGAELSSVATTDFKGVVFGSPTNPAKILKMDMSLDPGIVLDGVVDTTVAPVDIRVINPIPVIPQSVERNTRKGTYLQDPATGSINFAGNFPVKRTVSWPIPVDLYVSQYVLGFEASKWIDLADFENGAKFSLFAIQFRKHDGSLNYTVHPEDSLLSLMARSTRWNYKPSIGLTVLSLVYELDVPIFIKRGPTSTVGVGEIVIEQEGDFSDFTKFTIHGSTVIPP